MLKNILQYTTYRELTSYERKRLLIAYHYLRHNILLAGGSLKDLFERMQAVVEHVRLHSTLGPGVDYPVLLDSNACKSPHHVYKRFKAIHYLGQSFKDYLEEQPHHYSHSIFWDIFLHVCEQYAHYIEGQKGKASAKYRANDIVNATRAAVAQITPVSFNEVVDHVEHVRTGDHFFGSSAGSIFGIRNGNSFLRMRAKAIFEVEDCEHMVYKNGEGYVSEMTQVSYLKDLQNPTCRCGVMGPTDNQSHLRMVIDSILESIGSSPDFALQDNLMHKVFEVQTKNADYGVLVTSSIEQPEDHVDLMTYRV